MHRLKSNLFGMEFRNLDLEYLTVNKSRELHFCIDKLSFAQFACHLFPKPTHITRNYPKKTKKKFPTPVKDERTERME